MILLLPIIFLLTACLNDPIQDDLLNYINKEMADTYKLEETAVSAYEGVSGSNYTDDQTMHDALVNEVMPNYSKLLENLKSANIQTDEVKAVHEHFIKGAEVQLKAFETIIDGLEKQDSGLIEEANGMLDEAVVHIDEYLKELNKLAEEHDVEWQEK